MPAADPTLGERLKQVRAESAQPLTKDDVASIIGEVVGTMGGDVSMLDLKLYTELEGLARYIQTARTEIAAIRPDKISQDYIMAATDELDAVVGATEEATGRILDAAEGLLNVADEKIEGPAKDEVTELAMSIFEASNFQDITGQRITKVVKTLKHIEAKIEALVHVLGEEVERARQNQVQEERKPARTTDEDLLNGPQLPGGACNQDEIDRLLASFD
ncbi:MAG: chemotaxis protein CheZ [Alphaproteobacteria bacterium]|nr:chemotaxis protein CheZ [Alphaproteobacteria bacterium]